MALTKRKRSETVAGAEPNSKKRAIKSPTTFDRATRSRTLDATRKAVRNTTELLEAVIIDLPAKTIFGIQRVSKQFRDLVNASVQIQQKLFLRSCGEPESWVLRALTKLSPLQIQKYELVRAGANVTDAVILGEPVTPVMFCAIIASPPLNGQEPTASRLGYWKTEQFTLDLTPFVAKPGSWQAVQLTDPPCKELQVVVYFNLDTGAVEAEEFTFEEPIHVSSESGITLGDLSNAVLGTKQQVRRRCSGWAGSIKTSITNILTKPKDKGGVGRIQLVDLKLEAEMKGLVIPSTKEWEDIRDRATEAEN